MIKLFAYYRISSDKQKIDSQIMAVRNFVDSLVDTKIKEEFKDIHISGVIRERKGLEQLLSRLDEVDGVVVFDETRLTRDLEYGIELMFDFQKKGKKLYIASTKEIKTLDQSTDQLIHMIKTWVSAEERNKFISRIRAGIFKRIADGKHFGRPRAKINWNKYDKLRAIGLNKSACARVMGIGVSTLFNHLKDRKSDVKHLVQKG